MFEEKGLIWILNNAVFCELLEIPKYLSIFAAKCEPELSKNDLWVCDYN